MTTKAAAPNGRSARVQAAVRTLFTERLLAGAIAREFGVEGNADFYTLGDYRLIGLVLEAGRALGFGSVAIDENIRTFLDGTYGVNRWQRDRDPWPWEPGGGDAALDRLFVECDAAIAETEARLNDVWKARDELSAARRREGAGAM